MTAVKILKEGKFAKITVLLLLLFLLVIGTFPGYISGKWQWQQPPAPTNLKQLKQLRKEGLNIPGWKSIEQKEQLVGGHKWSLQHFKKPDGNKEFLLLLLPQIGIRDQPQVEWVEINGWQQWQVAQEAAKEFSVKAIANPKTNNSGADTDRKVEARFFRGSTDQETFAVLQWYAWAKGGHPSPLKWFFTDQLAQWQRKRAPWAAVSIIVPMEPLGQVETTWSEVQSIGESVQMALASIL
jgi:cyanoexosortase B-associated protein